MSEPTHKNDNKLPDLRVLKAAQESGAGTGEFDVESILENLADAGVDVGELTADDPELNRLLVGDLGGQAVAQMEAELQEQWDREQLVAEVTRVWDSPVVTISEEHVAGFDETYVPDRDREQLIADTNWWVQYGEWYDKQIAAHKKMKERVLGEVRRDMADSVDGGEVLTSRVVDERAHSLFFDFDDEESRAEGALWASFGDFVTGRTITSELLNEVEDLDVRFVIAQWQGGDDTVFVPLTILLRNAAVNGGPEEHMVVRELLDVLADRGHNKTGEPGIPGELHEKQGQRR